MKTPYESLISNTKPFNFLMPDPIRAYLDLMVQAKKGTEPVPTITDTIIDMVQHDMDMIPVESLYSLSDALKSDHKLAESIVKVMITRAYRQDQVKIISINNEVTGKQDKSASLMEVDLPINPYYVVALFMSDLAKTKNDVTELICHSSMRPLLECAVLGTPWERVKITSANIPVLQYHIIALSIDRRPDIIGIVKSHAFARMNKDDHGAFFFEERMLKVCAKEIQHGFSQEQRAAAMRVRFAAVLNGALTKKMDACMNHEPVWFHRPNSHKMSMSGANEWIQEKKAVDKALEICSKRTPAYCEASSADTEYKKTFYIEVGNMEPDEVAAFMREIQKPMKKTPNAVNMDFKYNPDNVTEDYFLPTREEPKAEYRIIETVNALGSSFQPQLMIGGQYINLCLSHLTLKSARRQIEDDKNMKRIIHRVD